MNVLLLQVDYISTRRRVVGGREGVVGERGGEMGERGDGKKGWWEEGMMGGRDGGRKG